MKKALYLHSSKWKCVSSSILQHVLVFLAISHQIIPTVAPLLCLSSSTTQLHFRMWGRMMVVRGKTTNPSPPSKAPIRGAGISISCHERKATEGSEFTWGEYENVFCRTDAQGTRMPWSHNTLNIFQLRCVPVENQKKKKGFHLCTCTSEP